MTAHFGGNQTTANVWTFSGIYRMNSAVVWVALSKDIFHQLDPQSHYLPEFVTICAINLPERHPKSFKIFKEPTDLCFFW